MIVSKGKQISIQIFPYMIAAIENKDEDGNITMIYNNYQGNTGFFRDRHGSDENFLIKKRSDIRNISNIIESPANWENYPLPGSFSFFIGFWRRGNIEVVCKRYDIMLYEKLDRAILHLEDLLM